MEVDQNLNSYQIKGKHYGEFKFFSKDTFLSSILLDSIMLTFISPIFPKTRVFFSNINL